MVSDAPPFLSSPALNTTTLVVSLLAATLAADTVPVSYRDSTAHGFLTLRSMDGRLLATGEQTQVARANVVTKRLTFRFSDGSLDDETTVFTDATSLRLMTYHHVQKGPSFSHPLELTIDATTGRVACRDLSAGRDQIEDTTMDLPADLSNGLTTNILENARLAALPLTVSYLAATPKPRLVHLVISSAGLEPLLAGGAARQARHYVVDVHIGGLEGILASAVRKPIPRSHLWMSTGVPTFLRAEAPLAMDGPIWRIDLASPIPRAN